MLYSKRRKNLGGVRRKRSNRKSFMSGGSGASQQAKVIWAWKSDAGFLLYSDADSKNIEEYYQEFIIDDDDSSNFTTSLGPMIFNFLNFTVRNVSEPYSPIINQWRDIKRLSRI